jgi:hypothetical protein
LLFDILVALSKLIPVHCLAAFSCRQLLDVAVPVVVVRALIGGQEWPLV